jgi:hypothetical protein
VSIDGGDPSHEASIRSGRMPTREIADMTSATAA